MSTLSIANPAGEFFAPNSPDALGLNISDRPHFRQGARYP